MTEPTRNAPGRVVAVDVMRGLVVLLLVPDVYGGFSLPRMARMHPDSAVWTSLGAAFSHVPWAGVAIWDLVMPVFVFVIGVSMALSRHARLAAGVGQAELLARAALRSATLFVLGMLLVFGLKSLADELVMLLVLATGLPLGRALARALGRAPPRRALAADLAVGAVALLVALGWMASQPQRSGDYDFNQILALIGLAYLPAFALLALRPAWQAAAAAAIVAAQAVAFVGYAHAGVAGGWTGLRDGVEAAWLRNANLASAFDLWLFNALPRTAAYTGNPAGYHTLQFVPLIAVMLVGALVGHQLARAVPSRTVAWRCTGAGVAGLVLAVVLTFAGFPLVKILWTPSWMAFSTSVCLLVTGVLLVAFETGRLERLAWPLAALGANALLLYVLSYTERWRFVALAGPLLDRLPAVAGWRPLAESLFVLGCFWLIAVALHRRGVLVRL